jgi:WD40 repeat protein
MRLPFLARVIIIAILSMFVAGCTRQPETQAPSPTAAAPGPTTAPPLPEPTAQPPMAGPTTRQPEPTVETIQAPTTAPTAQPAASQRLLFIQTQLEGQSELWISALDGSDRRRIIACPDGCSIAVVVSSPDGGQVAYLAQPPGETPEIRIVRVDGSDDRSLDRGGMLAEGAFSPDGAQLAFLRSRQADNPAGSESSVWAVPTAGGEARQVSPWHTLVSPPAWADNDHLIYGANETFAAAGERIFRIALQDGVEPEVLAAGRLSALSPDRASALVLLDMTDNIGPDTRFSYAVVGLSNPSQPLATLQLRPGQQAWSPDGSLLAVYSAYGDIEVVDATSGDTTLLKPAPLGKLEPYLTTIAWGRDGSSIIYSGQGEGPKPEFELRSLRVDGGGEELLMRLPVGSGSNFVLVP